MKCFQIFLNVHLLIFKNKNHCLEKLIFLSKKCIYFVVVCAVLRQCTQHQSCRARTMYTASYQRREKWQQLLPCLTLIVRG